MDILTFGVAAIAALMMLLAALDAIAQRFGAPLPILAAAAGIVLGVGIGLVDPFDKGFILDSYDLWFVNSLALTPQNVVLLLLPPLLFELTLGVDVRKLRQDIWVVALMAVIAVLVATAFVGTGLALASSLSFMACLLLGATISTTDPAAVVAIFRRIGAPRRLLIVLEGESLLNDAAAIALFVLFTEILRSGATPNLGDAALSFGYLFACGALVGFASSIIASHLIALMSGNFPAQVSVTLATVYAAYLGAELVAGASGVVAVVTAGLTLTVSGASRVSSEDWQALRTVWLQLGYWSNGLIILIAAALSPTILRSLDWQGLVLVAIAAGAAMAARAFVLFVMLPALDRLGASAPMTGRHKLLVWWGGIRGAVTLLLALSLANSTVLSDETGRLLAAIGIAFVFVTLFVNGSTLALVTRALGLHHLTSSDRALRRDLVSRTVQGSIDHVDEIAERYGIGSELIAPVRNELTRRLTTIDGDQHQSVASFGDRLRTGLIIVASQERRLLRQHYDDGLIGRDTMRDLQRVAENLADSARARGREGYGDVAMASTDYPRAFRVAAFVQRFLWIDRPVALRLANRFRQLFAWEVVLKRLAEFVAHDIEDLLGRDIAENIGELLRQRQALVREALLSLELQYPNYADGLRCAFVERAALRWESSRYDRFLREAIIGPDLYRVLRTDIDRRLRATYKPPTLDVLLDRRGVIMKVPLFSGLSEQLRKSLERAMRVRSALPGEVVAARGDRGDAMYFIASGAVDVVDVHQRVQARIGSGEFFGEVAILRPTRRRPTSIIATGFCKLLVLRRADFRRLAKKFPELDVALQSGVSEKQARRKRANAEPATT